MLKTFAREIVANSTISTPDFDALPLAAARIARARWQEWIENVARNAVERVVEPAGALAREAAPGDTPHTVSSVVRRFRVASPYDYFPEIVEQYAQRKGINEIRGEALASLLHRIDRRMTEGFSGEEWVSLAEPLFELGRAHASGAVPAELVRRFLEVRGAGTFVSRIPEQGSLTIEDFREKLGVAPQSDSPEPEAASEPVDAPEVKYPPPTPGAGDGAVASDHSFGDLSEPTLAEFFGGSESVREEADATNGEASTPLWKRFLSKDTPQEEADDTSVLESDNHAPLWKRFSRPSGAEVEVASEREVEATLSSQPHSVDEVEPDVENVPTQPRTLEDLEADVLGEAAGEWRSLYVDSLFGGKEEVYEHVLSMLLLAEDWPAASEIIAEEVFKKRKVDIYAVPAVAFTDAVETQFVDGE